jgi:hypothetical protein
MDLITAARSIDALYTEWRRQIRAVAHVTSAVVLAARFGCWGLKEPHGAAGVAGRAAGGAGGTEDLYGTQRFPDPDAARVQAWLSPIIGRSHAAELADAVDAEPPPPAAWRPRGAPG